MDVSTVTPTKPPLATGPGIHEIEVAWKGRTLRAPSLEVEGKRIVVLGRWIREASVQDEEWVEGEVENPLQVVASLKQNRLKADVFTFAQKIDNTEPRHRCHMEWDNAAAVPITSYEDWWERRLPQVTRKNVRRGLKRGVTVRKVPFNDDLIQGIMSVQNESPLKQGTLNVHYGKDFATVRRDYGSFLDRSEFFGAYFGTQLIGFIKLVHIGPAASILNLSCMNSHYDKRPANVLLAKVVEHCVERRLRYLLYGKYHYGNKTSNPLTEFKRRNGFEKILIPRYYVPLTSWGRVVVALRLYRGPIGLLPGWLISILLAARSAACRSLAQLKQRDGTSSSPQENTDEDR